MWFASVLRDGFAVTVTGEYRSFSSLGSSLLRGLLAGCSLSVGVDESVELIMSGFSSLEVHPDVVDGVRALSEEGHRLVTLSNWAASVAEGLLGRAGVRDCFELLLSVDEAGRWKPAREVYAYGLSSCGVGPEAAVLVAVHPWDLHGGPYPDVFEPPTWRIGSVGALAGRLAGGLAG